MSAERSSRQQKKQVFVDAASKAISVVILASLSLVVFSYRRALEPLYGSAPTNLHINKVIWSACILGSFAPTLSIWPATLVAGILLTAMPASSYWVAVYTGRMGDPVWGPVATHLVVLAPILYIGVAIIKALQENPDQQGAAASTQQLITLPVCQTAITALQGLWPAIPYTSSISENQVFAQLGTFAVVLWIVAPLLPSLDASPESESTPAPVVPPAAPKTKAQRKKVSIDKPSQPINSPKTPTQGPAGLNMQRAVLLPILPLLTFTLFRSPTLPKPLPEPYTHPTYPLRILSSVRSSFSSVVVVGESLPSNPGVSGTMDYLRYLRAGHSLLGGVWVGPKAQSDSGPPSVDEAGEAIGDSIYSAFVVQEATRLVERPDHTEPQNALMIGLGAGIAATSFMKHNISTTIVEIDPAVYDAAKRFFGLPAPEPGKLFFQDARSWVSARQSRLEDQENTEEGSLGVVRIIVHDCFSGGSVPGHLFTQKFWIYLKTLMSPNGVVAVNFAGRLNTDSARSIIVTLQSVFPQCRAFYDSLTPAEDIENEFVNWVLFCSPSSYPLKFRRSESSDYLGSRLRKHVLSNLPEREADLSKVVESISEKEREQYVLLDGKNPLVQWQEKDAPWDTRASAVSSPNTVLLSTSPAAVSRNAGSLSTSYQNNMHDEITTRQWSFNAFEWIIRDVSRLKEFVESPAPVDNDAAADGSEALGSEADEFEVLRESPMLDGKFKLEIVKASNLELSEGLIPQRRGLRPNRSRSISLLS
ncbi:Polyamine aminopropyltransferase [Grifola frondosa]|uniref:Polyamine aminopropyltransferase n=1 Tax=Grifola frondosa TaxID=5627 RepID=A0A1C7MH21_GRIFR|nr:Polyamine aminopropyltransferase [Grifola frondosa]